MLPEETVRAIEALTVLRNRKRTGAPGDITAERAVEYLASLKPSCLPLTRLLAESLQSNPNWTIRLIDSAALSR